MHIAWLLFLLPFLFTSLKPQEEYKAHQIYGFTQGTSYQITYYTKGSIIGKDQITHILGGIDSSLSIYKPYSLISQFNRSPSGLQADRHLEQVVKKSLKVTRKTDGAFDITVLPLVQAWGFGSEPIAALPDSATIRSLLRCVGMGKVRLQKRQLQKTAPCVKIDVNGIAQGYTVDVLAEFLEQKGIKNYLVEVGGEIRVKGRKLPGNEKMAIGIEGPTQNETDQSPLLKIVKLEKGAITTSGNYRKYYQSGNKRISHLIDAKSGFPIQNEMISVTVWAKDAITADGYDNALMGMGIQKALSFARRRKEIEAYFVYQKPDGSVADTATTGFYRMMAK